MCTFVSEGPSLYEYRTVQKTIVVGAGLWYGTKDDMAFLALKGGQKSSDRRDNTTMGFLPEFYLQKKTLCLPNVVGAVNLYITSLLSRSRGMRKYRLEISPIPNYRLFSVLFPSSSTSCLSSSSSSEKQRRRVSRCHSLTY